MNRNKTKEINIIVIGESFIGKTALIQRFNTNEYIQNFYATLGTDFIEKKMMVGSDKVIARIWDTPGQERFMILKRSFFLRADGILLVYNVAQIETFERTFKWLKSFKENIFSLIPKYLVANRKDLKKDREVTMEEGKKRANDYGMEYYETSVVTGENVKAVFQDIVTDAYNAKRKREINPSFLLNDSK